MGAGEGWGSDGAGGGTRWGRRWDWMVAGARWCVWRGRWEWGLVGGDRVGPDKNRGQMGEAGVRPDGVGDGIRGLGEPAGDGEVADPYLVSIPQSGTPSPIWSK